MQPVNENSKVPDKVECVKDAEAISFDIETLEAIKRGLEDMDRGKTISASVVHERLRHID